MSVIEQSRELTEQEKIDWDYSYTKANISGRDNWIPEYAIALKGKKCCVNCEYYNESHYCDKDVSNVYCENYLESTDTFYCSYHRFKV